MQRRLEVEETLAWQHTEQALVVQTLEELEEIVVPTHLAYVLHICEALAVACDTLRSVLHVDQHEREALAELLRARVDHKVEPWLHRLEEATQDVSETVFLAAVLLLEGEDEIDLRKRLAFIANETEVRLDVEQVQEVFRHTIELLESVKHFVHSAHLTLAVLMLHVTVFDESLLVVETTVPGELLERLRNLVVAIAKDDNVHLLVAELEA